MKYFKNVFFMAITVGCFSNCFSQKSLYEFGALGSSNLDESVKVQNAINASENKTLFIPDDTFYVRNLSGVNNITIRTIGKGMLKYYTGTATKNGRMLQFKDKKGWTLDGVVIDGNFPAAYGTALQVINCSQFTIKNSVIKNNFGEGIAASNASSGLITNNKIINTDVGFLSIGGCAQIEFSYNEIRDGTSDGFALWGFTKSLVDSNLNIHHNTVSNKPTGSAFLIRYSKNFDIHDNYVQNCSVGFGHDEAGDYNPGGMIINNNKFHKCRVGINAAIHNSTITANVIDSTQEHAILLGSFLGHNDFTYENVIKKNTINMVMLGIKLDYTSKITIDSNKITNCKSGSGIETYGVSRNVLITNNTLSYANYGIYVTLINSRIEKNTISETIYTGLSIGSDSIVNNDTIRNNKILNASINGYEDGIRLQQSKNSIIDGNSILDNRTPVKTQTGIRLISVSDKNIIINNTMQALHNMVNGGTNTTVNGNIYTPVIIMNKNPIVKRGSLLLRRNFYSNICCIYTETATANSE